MPEVHADCAPLWVSALGQYVQELALAPFEPLMVQQPSAFAVGHELTTLPPPIVQAFVNCVVESESPPEMPVHSSTPAVVTSQYVPDGVPPPEEDELQPTPMASETPRSPARPRPIK
jgi:hypothetical protein